MFQSGLPCARHLRGFLLGIAVLASTPTAALPAVACGDVNGDGVVNIGDALLVAQFDVGLRQCGIVPFSHPEVCDVNGDGACNIGDALRIAQCDAGVISCAFTCRPFTCPTTTTTTTSSTTTTTLRFMDNGDGTVTDNQTGLIWEKKVNNVCSNANIACTSNLDCPNGACLPCLHCVNDTYTWSSSGTGPDGTAFTSFLDMLNGGTTGVGNCKSTDCCFSENTGGFNGHCDWRLPTLDELWSIDTGAPGCGSGSPCTDPVFGPTAASDYWSSTTDNLSDSNAWFVNFGTTAMFGADSKGGSRFVRAVRGPRAALSTSRFADNGDGTVTDHQTGLIWEKKVRGQCSVCQVGFACPCITDTDCSAGTCLGGCVHCVNDTYTWSSSGTGPDGTAFTSFLATLNGGATGVGNCVSSFGNPQTGGFTNNCDWRLPTVEELYTIVDLNAAGCGSGSPCIDPIFGPTQSMSLAFGGSGYWSSTDFPFPGDKWIVNFFGDPQVPGSSSPGGVFGSGSQFKFFVRAVRGGS